MIAIPVGEYVVKIRISLVLVAFWLLLFSQVTTADSLVARAFFKSYDFVNSPLYLSIGDQVSDGCLPNPAAIKDAWEVELRRLGFQMGSVTDSSYDFQITVFGFAINDYDCVVSVESLVHSPGSSVTLPSGNSVRGTILLWTKLDMLTGPKTSMQNRIRDKARDHVNAFFLKVSQAKDSAQ